MGRACRSEGVVRIPAIPTRYKGVNFRSRLEARYAALFNTLGWEWEYEPVDLGGPTCGYIPDFIITRGHPSALLVECKPFVDTTNADAQDAASVATKVAKAWHGDAVIVCAAWHVEPAAKSTGERITLTDDGITVHPTPPDAGTRVRIGRARLDGRPWADAYLAREHIPPYPKPEPDDARDYWSIETRANAHTLLAPLDLLAARTAWSDAGNATQWKAPK